MRPKSSRASIAARAAVFLAAAFVTLGCSDGRDSFVAPHFVTFRPSSGTVSAVRLSPVNEPFVRDSLEIGGGNEGWGLSPEAGLGLAFDTQTSSLTQIRFRPFDAIREEQRFFNVASFPVEGITFAPGGNLAILRQGNFASLKLLRYDSPTAPALSADIVPSDPVTRLDFAPDGRYGIFRVVGRDDRLLVLDPADLGDPILPYDIEPGSTLVELTFLELVPDVFVALDNANGDLRTFRYTDRDTKSLDLGRLAIDDAAPVRLQPFRQTATLALASSTEVFTVDVEDPAAPILRNRLALPTPTEPSFLAVSPDDRFLALAESSSGRVLLYNLEVPESPLLVGSFSLGANVTDIRFTSRDEVRAFRNAPTLLVLSSAGMSLVGLRDSIRPFLNPPVAFALSSDYESFRMRDEVFLTGLNEGGAVVTYDLRKGEEVRLVGTFDLGLGGGLSATEIAR